MIAHSFHNLSLGEGGGTQEPNSHLLSAISTLEEMMLDSLWGGTNVVGLLSLCSFPSEAPAGPETCWPLSLGLTTDQYFVVSVLQGLAKISSTKITSLCVVLLF